MCWGGGGVGKEGMGQKRGGETEDGEMNQLLCDDNFVSMKKPQIMVLCRYTCTSITVNTLFLLIYLSRNTVHHCDR